MSEPGTHEGQIVIGDISTVGEGPEAGVPTVKFVHYSGAQQLILWLPRPGYRGYGELVVTRDGVEVERAPVMSRVNGSVQILFYTLSWPPGAYAITISHGDGFCHAVALTKYAPGMEPTPPPPPPEPVVDHPPILYRDGFGNLIPNVDLEMREKAIERLVNRFARRLEYEGNFRDGYVIYIEGGRRIRFFHEMCGGEMKFTIDVPTVEQWEARTGTPVAERDDIVSFVAERVKREQASSWRYEITDRSIDFY